MESSKTILRNRVDDILERLDDIEALVESLPPSHETSRASNRISDAKRELRKYKWSKV